MKKKGVNVMLFLQIIFITSKVGPFFAIIILHYFCLNAKYNIGKSIIQTFMILSGVYYQFIPCQMIFDVKMEYFCTRSNS